MKNFKKQNEALHRIGMAFALVAIGDVVQAQDTSNSTANVIEEIVVTATKRQASLQDVPMAISAITEDSIVKEGIEGGADFARRIPGVIFNQGGKNQVTNFVVRGIATSANDEFVNKPVSVYIDDIPITTSNGSVQPDPRLYDVERIEVLKGPQGTLFGAGTLAGVVRIVTNKADPTGFKASLSTDIGSSGSDSIRQRYNGMVNIPLIDDTLALRLVGYYRDEEGYVDNIGTGEQNSDSIVDKGARAALRWYVNDNLTADFVVLYQDSQPEDSSLFNPGLGTHVRSTFKPEVTNAEISNYNLTLKYDFDFATLTSSTNLSDVEAFNGNDLSSIFGGLYPWGFRNTVTDDVFVQELRLVSNTDAKLDWIVGAYYSDRETDVDEEHHTTQAYLDSQSITLLNGQSFINNLRNKNDEESAIFAELGYQISDTLKATIGIRRGSTESTDYLLAGGFGSGSWFGAVFGGGNQVVVSPANQLQKWATGKQDYTTTKLSLSWQPRDNLNFYTLASEGFRGGTINQGASTRGGVSAVDPTDVVIPGSADSDSLWNYEIGMKARWLDGTLMTNVSAYYIPWEDIQMNAQRLSDGAAFTTNIGEAVSKGLEVEILASPSQAWDLGLNLTFQDAEVTELTADESAMAGAVEGSDLASPDFQASGFIQYTKELDNNQHFYVRTDIQVMGDNINTFPFVTGQPGVPYGNAERSDKHTNVNISAAWVTEKWTATLYGENVLDNDDFAYVYPQTFLGSRYATLRPRTWGLRLSMDL
jgi:iron complex outermembrane recepter protein